MSDQYNNLRSNGFVFALERLPDTAFRIIQVEMPSIEIQPVETPTRTGDQYFPGSEITFSEMTLRFIIDEDMKNYIELYNWITQQRYTTDFIPTKTQEILMVSDGTLTMLNNSNVANKTFYFHDMFPISLSGMTFETNISEPSIVECTVNFKFSYFHLK
jgi:hypothetical protein